MFEDIKKVLIDAINVDEEEIKPEAKLNDDLGIDSLAAVELALELENEFDIRIEDEELAKLETVQDVIDIIEAKNRCCAGTSAPGNALFLVDIGYPDTLFVD